MGAEIYPKLSPKWGKNYKALDITLSFRWKLLSLGTGKSPKAGPAVS